MATKSNWKKETPYGNYQDVNQNHKDHDKWLSDRRKSIMRQNNVGKGFFTRKYANNIQAW